MVALPRLVSFSYSWLTVSLHLCRGRFGQVHRCMERSTGLALAAKIIKVKNLKDRVRHLPQASLVLPAKPRIFHLFSSPLRAKQEA